MRSRASRRSVSIWVSPGPRVPMPPSMRPAPRRSRCVQSPRMRARLYSSWASSTWSLPSAEWAWSAKMSRMIAVRSITGTPSACSRLRSWRGSSSSSQATRLASDVLDRLLELGELAACRSSGPDRAARGAGRARPPPPRRRCAAARAARRGRARAGAGADAERALARPRVADPVAVAVSELRPLRLRSMCSSLGGRDGAGSCEPLHGRHHALRARTRSGVELPGSTTTPRRGRPARTRGRRRSGARRARRRPRRSPRCGGARGRRPRRSRGRRPAPRSAAACRTGGAWPAGGGPAGRRRRRRRWSRRAGSRGRRPRRPGRRARRRLRGANDGRSREQSGELERARASAGCGATPRRSSSASQSRAGPSPRGPPSGAPTRHHHVAERPAARRPPAAAEPGSKKMRAQPDRRLRRADLLQHRQLERSPAWGRRRSSASARRGYPAAARPPRSAARRRSVSEMRKKPSPLGP